MVERAPHVRFLTNAREHAGLSVRDAAERMGISDASLWDLETFDDELWIYSLPDVDRFCRVLGTRLDALFNVDDGVLPLPAEELVNQIREHCRSAGITVEQFENRSGVWVAHSLDDPASFYTGYALDALRDICAELGIDWRRVVAAYRPAA